MGNFCCFPIHQPQRQHPVPSSLVPPFTADRVPNFTLLRIRPPDGVNVEIFSYDEMAEATGYWDSGKIIGEGGFGQVYKGVLRANLRPYYVRDIQVAIKDQNSHGHQGAIEWLSEIKILGKFRHPNLVKLIGYCCQLHSRILVYEYMENGSLDNILFSGKGRLLSWPNRMKIALHTARGLAYLHKQRISIICRDLEPANILLDKDFNAKISGLEYARKGPTGEQLHVSTQSIGTPGYAAPEYICTGHLTKYCNIFSFGVVLLELLFGRSVIDPYRGPDMQNLVDMALQNIHEDDKILKMVDLTLKVPYPEETALKVAKLACNCINPNPLERPEMSKVLEILERIQENAGVMDQGASSSSSTLHKSEPTVIKGEGSSSSTQQQVPIGGSDEPKQKEIHPRGRKGFLAPLPVSDALKKFLGNGESELSRADAVKRIWNHIKQNNLQDPSRKGMVICDEKLKELFGVDTFHGFFVSKLLSVHLLKTRH